MIERECEQKYNVSMQCSIHGDTYREYQTEWLYVSSIFWALPRGSQKRLLASSSPPISLSVRPPACISTALNARIFVKSDLEGFYENIFKKSKFA